MKRKRARRLRKAALYSALLHIPVLLIFGFFFYHPDTAVEKVGATEKVTIERRVRPKPVVHVAEQAKPSHAASKVTTVAKAPVDKPIQPPVAYVPKKPVLITPTFAPRVLVQPKVLEKVPEPKIVASIQKPAAATKTASRYSEQQIAAIEHSLGDSIAKDRDKENPLAVQATTDPGEGMKHYGTDVSSLTDGGLGHSGLCSPVSSWEADGWDYYYLICDVKATDGTFDREGIPWPVRHRPNHDPYNGTDNEQAPIAMPLPGWHLPAGEHVADGVRQYAAEHGVSL